MVVSWYMAAPEVGFWMLADVYGYARVLGSFGSGVGYLGYSRRTARRHYSL